MKSFRTSPGTTLTALWQISIRTSRIWIGHGSSSAWGIDPVSWATWRQRRYELLQTSYLALHTGAVRCQKRRLFISRGSKPRFSSSIYLRLFQVNNALLNREMKSFIKIIGATPSRATDEMRDSVMPEFKMSEKSQFLRDLFLIKRMSGSGSRVSAGHGSALGDESAAFRSCDS